MIGLTRSQADFARIAGELADILGRPPRLIEIAAEYGCDKSGATALAKGLVERGWARPGMRKGLVLLHRLPPPAECDVALTEAGQAAIAAGVVA